MSSIAGSAPLQGTKLKMVSPMLDGGGKPIAHYVEKCPAKSGGFTFTELTAQEFATKSTPGCNIYTQLQMAIPTATNHGGYLNNDECYAANGQDTVCMVKDVDVVILKTEYSGTLPLISTAKDIRSVDGTAFIDVTNGTATIK